VEINQLGLYRVMMSYDRYRAGYLTKVVASALLHVYLVRKREAAWYHFFMRHFAAYLQGQSAQASAVRAYLLERLPAVLPKLPQYFVGMLLLYDTERLEVKMRARKALAAHMKLLQEVIRKINRLEEEKQVEKEKGTTQPVEYFLFYIIHLLAHLPYIENDAPKYIQSTQYVVVMLVAV